MTKDELLQRLTDIEWDDFECKSALDKMPEDVWETVSAFSNTSGGWIVFGIRLHGKRFEIQGVNNGEKTESDFLNTLRNGQKLTFYRQDGGVNGGVSGGVNDREMLSARQSVVMKAIELNDRHTAKSLSKQLDIALRTVERELAFLREKGFIARDGADKNGVWKILK